MATFIPINDTRPYNSYVAAANNTNFVFDWFVQKEEYVTVYKNEVKLLYIQDYSFTPNSIGSATGGAIQLALPCASGDIIVIMRNSAIKRVTGYSESGEFRASTINLEINYVLTLIQELSFKIGRCLVLSETDANTLPGDIILPSVNQRKKKYLYFDENGKLTAANGTNIDIYNDLYDALYNNFLAPWRQQLSTNWKSYSSSSVINKSHRRIKAVTTVATVLQLPTLTDADDGLDFFILNDSTSVFPCVISLQDDTASIPNSTARNNLLFPGESKRYFYNAAGKEWNFLE